MVDFDQRVEFRRNELCIIGAGPAGLSAAAHCAELSIPYVLLEAADHASNTIYKYQKGKHVMAEPQILPLRSTLSFAAGKRETVLDTWNTEIAKLRVDIRYGQEIVAIGLQGNLRTLGVPGEDLPRVQYQLDDPQAFDGETIVVVGAGDAAIENAVALAEQNQVVLINRNEEFARCKEGNLTLVLNAIKEGKIECRYGSSAMKVEDAGGDVPLRFKVRTPDGPDTIECHRVIARLGGIPPRKLVEGFGVKFPSNDPNAVPRITDHYESNVKGLYVIGALGGYPLIKQAMNQGYEAVEFALGKSVAPADEPLLEQKFAAFARGKSVAEVLDFGDALPARERGELLLEQGLVGGCDRFPERELHGLVALVHRLLDERIAAERADYVEPVDVGLVAVGEPGDGVGIGAREFHAEALDELARRDPAQARDDAVALDHVRTVGRLHLEAQR